MSYSTETNKEKQADLKKRIASITDDIILRLTVSDPLDNVSQKTVALKIMLLFKFFAVIIPHRRLDKNYQSKIKSLIEQMKNWDEILPIEILPNYSIINVSYQQNNF